MSDIHSVAVFCGASIGTAPAFRAAAEALGRGLATAGMRLVYGGGQVGLMGAVADAALAAGGEVIGVLPDKLFEREVAHAGLTELHTVGSMHERKALMSDLADAFVALPGGYGTIEEVVEAVTWTQLGIHAKPVGLLDVEGYFEHLVAVLDRGVADGLLRTESRSLLLCDDDPVRLLERLRTGAPPPAEWNDPPTP